MQPDSQALLVDAATAIAAIGEFTSGKGADDYLADVLLRSAVERQLRITGETLSQIRRKDPETAAAIPGTIEAIGLRNVHAHSYGTVDDDIVWRTITDELPALRASLEGALHRSA